MIYDAMHEALAVRATTAASPWSRRPATGPPTSTRPTRFDDTSPDFPRRRRPGTPTEAYPRTVTNDCLDLPSEGPNVLSVSSVGPSGIKADYSNYGVSEITVAAPGGYFRDFFGTKQFRSALSEIWAPYPEVVARANGEVTNGGGVPNNEFVRPLLHEGPPAAPTTRASRAPRWPRPTSPAWRRSIIGALGGDADPAVVRSILEQTAADHACPVPATVDYTLVGRPASWNATCTGTATLNNFYGNGLVDAAAAVALAESL